MRYPGVSKERKNIKKCHNHITRIKTHKIRRGIKNGKAQIIIY